MFSVDYKTYSAEFVQKAVEQAIKAGLVDTHPKAGLKSYAKFGLTVSTPRGEMVAYSSYEDDDYPGIAVDIVLDETMVGVVTSEVVRPEGNKLFSRVFANTDEDEVTHHIQHTGSALEGKSC